MMQTIFQLRASGRANKEAIDAATPHVLLIENDNQLAQLITQELNYEGYQTTLTKDGISGLLAARQTNPHLIIVSWSLSGISCIDFCRRLRSTHNNVPIIVLTHEGQVSERVMGLDAGASDCLSKPCAAGFSQRKLSVFQCPPGCRWSYAVQPIQLIKASLKNLTLSRSNHGCRSS